MRTTTIASMIGAGAGCFAFGAMDNAQRRTLGRIGGASAGVAGAGVMLASGAARTGNDAVFRFAAPPAAALGAFGLMLGMLSMTEPERP